MRAIFEASIQAGWVIATTAGLLYWGRRHGKSNPYKDGLLRYDGALCAFLGAGLRVIGDKVLQHKQLSAREEGFAVMLLLVSGVLAFLRKTYADRLYRRTLDSMNAQYSALMQREAARLAPYRWTDPSSFNAGYEFALEHGETELALKIRDEQPPEWSAGFVQGCINRFETSVRSEEEEEDRRA